MPSQYIHFYAIPPTLSIKQLFFLHASHYTFQKETSNQFFQRKLSISCMVNLQYWGASAGHNLHLTCGASQLPPVPQSHQLRGVVWQGPLTVNTWSAPIQVKKAGTGEEVCVCTHKANTLQWMLRFVFTCWATVHWGQEMLLSTQSHKLQHDITSTTPAALWYLLEILLIAYLKTGWDFIHPFTW